MMLSFAPVARAALVAAVSAFGPLYCGAAQTPTGMPQRFAALARIGVSRGHVVAVAVHESGGRLLAALDGGPVLDLRRHSVRAPGFRVLARFGGRLLDATPDPVRTVRGTVRGAADSEVAGTWVDGALEARVRIGRAVYWLQPVPEDGSSSGNRRHVLFTAADAGADHHGCGVPVEARGTAPHRHGGRRREEGIHTAELACDADHEYFLRYGSVGAVQTRIESLVNIVNQQFESEVGISHHITAIVVQTGSAQPYTATDPVRLIDQFRSHWNRHHGAISRDLAQLYTGKDLDGSTVGYAMIGVVCDVSAAYSIVQADYTSTLSRATDLIAHELGHNWSAGHCSCPSHTMNPIITGANTFEPLQTVPGILRFRDSRACLGGGGGPSAAISVHVDSIDVGTLSIGRGSKVAQAVVVVVDDLGRPVADADVRGAFTGSIAEQVGGRTDASGRLLLRTGGTASRKVEVTFCVTGIAAALPYDPQLDRESCDHN